MRKNRIKIEWNDEAVNAAIAEWVKTDPFRVEITVTPPNPSMYAGLFYPRHLIGRGLPTLEA